MTRLARLILLALAISLLACAAWSAAQHDIPAGLTLFILAILAGMFERLLATGEK
jgi:hypothetical protein